MGNKKPKRHILYPDAINIFVDGAMDYDQHQTGGIGFEIVFPEMSNLENLEEFYRLDNQDIHRLETIALLESIETLNSWINNNDGISLDRPRVIIHTDRHSNEWLLNKSTVAGWKRHGWKNKDGNPVKNRDLIEKIDKERKKLEQLIKGRVDIEFIRRKKNRRADKLATKGKESENRSKMIINKPYVGVARRLYDGDEVCYKDLRIGQELLVRKYREKSVGKMYEISTEIVDGEHFGKVVKMYVDFMQVAEFHRHHYYRITIHEVGAYHIKIRDIEEVEHKTEADKP